MFEKASKESQFSLAPLRPPKAREWERDRHSLDFSLTTISRRSSQT